jgi:hypothetical protein
MNFDRKLKLKSLCLIVACTNVHIVHPKRMVVLHKFYIYSIYECIATELYIPTSHYITKGPRSLHSSCNSCEAIRLSLNLRGFLYYHHGAANGVEANCGRLYFRGYILNTSILF